MWISRILCIIVMITQAFSRDTQAQTQARTQVFYHIYAAGDWSTIVNDQLT